MTDIVSDKQIKEILANIHAGIKAGVTKSKATMIADSIMATLDHHDILEGWEDDRHNALRDEIATDIKDGLGI